MNTVGLRRRDRFRSMMALCFYAAFVIATPAVNDTNITRIPTSPSCEVTATMVEGTLVLSRLKARVRIPMPIKQAWYRVEFIFEDWNRVARFQTQQGGVAYVTVTREGIPVKDPLTQSPSWPYGDVTAIP